MLSFYALSWYFNVFFYEKQCRAIKNDTYAPPGVARRPCYRPTKSNKWCSSDRTGVLSQRLGPLIRPSRREKRRQTSAPKKLPWCRGRRSVRKLQLRCSWLDCFVLVLFFFPWKCDVVQPVFVTFCNLKSPSFLWVDSFGTTKHVWYNTHVCLFFQLPIRWTDTVRPCHAMRLRSLMKHCDHSEIV